VVAPIETLRVLVTVKAYPAVGKKHGEAVCVAGIDVDARRWIRLYPVPFRDLPDPNRFQKYETIELRARKAATDPRPESYTPDTGSIKVIRKRLPGGKARGRRAYVEPLESASMCEIRRRREADGTSLGVFRPAELVDFLVEEDRTPWDPEKQVRIDQTSLLMPGKTALEKVPYRFRYVYRCADPDCNGHRQMIIDWEIGASFRRFRDRYGSEERAVEEVQRKWTEELWGPNRDTFFYTGNHHDNPDGFLVLGVFWPEKLGPTGGGPSPAGQGELLPPR
jgi:hypothetical protein